MFQFCCAKSSILRREGFGEVRQSGSGCWVNWVGRVASWRAYYCGRGSAMERLAVVGRGESPRLFPRLLKRLGCMFGIACPAGLLATIRCIRGANLMDVCGPRKGATEIIWKVMDAIFS